MSALTFNHWQPDFLAAFTTQQFQAFNSVILESALLVDLLNSFKGFIDTSGQGKGQQQGTGYDADDGNIYVDTSSLPDGTAFGSFGDLAESLGHELGHALVSGGKSDVIHQPTVTQGIQNGLNAEGVAVATEFVVAYQLASQTGTPTLSALEQLTGFPPDVIRKLEDALAAGGGAASISSLRQLDDSTYLPAAEAIGAAYYSSQHPSVAGPNPHLPLGDPAGFTYDNYYGDSWVLANVFQLSADAVDWTKMTAASLRIGINGFTGKNITLKTPGSVLTGLGSFQVVAGETLSFSGATSYSNKGVVTLATATAATVVGGLGNNDVLYARPGTDLFQIDLPPSLPDGYSARIVDTAGQGSIELYSPPTPFGSSPLTATGTDQWTDGTYNYQFVPWAQISSSDLQGIDASAFAPFDVSASSGELKIAVGSGAAIDVIGFSLQQAESLGGFLGIYIPPTLTLLPNGVGSGSSPAPDFDAGTSQSYTVSVAYASEVPQTVTVALSGAAAADFGLAVGDGIEPLGSNGSFTVTIPAGATSAAFTLVNTGDVGSDAPLQLTATMPDPSDPSLTETGAPLTQNYVEPTDDPFADPQPTGGISGTVQTDPSTQTQYTLYQGDGGNDSIGTGSGLNAVDLGSGSDLVNAVSGGAVIAGGVSTSKNSSGNLALVGDTGGNGNNLITLNDNADVVIAGNGNNKIFGNTEIDIATAVTQANSDAGSGNKGAFIGAGDGDNTITGGDGNDLMMVGTGQNVLVLGPGADTVLAGVEALSASVGWSTSTNGNEILPNEVNWQTNGYTAPAGVVYEGNAKLPTDIPFGSGNDTIFGGSGDALIYLSNGDNAVELGTGNSTVFGGMGDNTIVGGGGDNYLRGGGGSDYIAAGNGDSDLVGQAGNNTLIGGAGKDTLVAGRDGSGWATADTGNNYVQAGSGATLILGSGGNDTLLGGTGNDTIEAGAGNEYVDGGSGADSISGGSGNDTLSAGSGNDTVWAGSGATTIYGGDGIDDLNGGSGANLIYAGDGGTADDATYVAAGSGDTTIYGGDGVDYIVGGAGNNVIYAGDGGNAQAATTIFVGSGNATVQGGDGIDQIYGGSGTNVLYAGDGGTQSEANLVSAGSGTATLYGGAGYDILKDSLGGSDVLSAGEGNNVLYGIGKDTLIAGSGIDFLSGSGDNTYVLSSDGGGAEIANAGGSESLEFSSDVGPTDISVSAGLSGSGQTELVLDYGEGTVTIDGGLSGTNVSSLAFGGSQSMSLTALIQQADAAGNAFDTVVAGNDGNLVFDTSTGDSLTGGSGNDTISAWGNDDTVTGAGNGTVIYAEGTGDQVAGGGGTDTLAGYGANTTLSGGLGNETFEINDASEVVQAKAGALSNTLYSSVSYTLPDNVDVLTLTGRGNLVASGNDDDANVITANSGNDTLYAGDGQDTLVSGTGVDELVGGSGTDTFFINNSNDQLLLRGYGGQDTIYSSVSYGLTRPVGYLTLTGSGNLTATDDAGYATLTGNAGNDTLVGGSGADTLIAGTGVDTFVTGTGNNTLVINNVADVIDVSPGTETDTVESSVSFTLQHSLDTLQLTGTLDLIGQGNGDLHDSITGNAGNDTLIAGAGNDTLVAGTGVDTLVSGSGQDLLEGGPADTFVLSGSGTAEIEMSQGSGTIQFRAGVIASDLSFSLHAGSNGQAALLISGDGTSVTVDGGLQGSIGQFDFADGSRLSLAQLLAAGHVESSTLVTADGSFILDGTQGDSLQGGRGNDTLVGTGAGDTIVAGSGNQAIYGYGTGELLDAGVGDDSLYGAGNDTLAAGSGNTALYGGSGGNTYLLTEGGTATLYDSGTASGPQVIFLPVGMTAADFFAHVSSNGDLILQSSSGNTIAVIRDFYSSANANTAWILADQSGNSQLLRDWVNTSSQGSTGASSYQAEVQALLEEYQANLGITLNEMGIQGATIADPSGHTLANQYNFTGVSTQNVTVQGGALHVGPSDSDQSQTTVTSEGTRTESYSVPVYSTFTIPGSVTFVPVGDSDLTNLDGEPLTPITIDGHTGYAYYTSPQTVTTQTGTRTVTDTVPVYSYYTTETQGFTERNIVGDGGSDIITAAAPFLGTLVTGDGNDVNVDLGIDDSYWDPVLPGGHLTYNHPDPLAPGAFIDVGNGINDTIEGTGSTDIIAAGRGFDYIVASLGSTIYVPMEGASTEVIATTNAPYYGSGPFPKNTLVLPAGVTPQNLHVQSIDDPTLGFPANQLDGNSASGLFLKLTYGDSTVLLEYDGQPPSSYLQQASSDDTDGINLVQFADGTVLTRAQLLAIAGNPVVVDGTYNPVITQLTQNVVENTEISAANLFTATDASGSGITLYQISNNSTSGAYFSLNGTAYSPGQEFQVAADQLSQLKYIPGALGSTDALTVKAFDGIVFGNQATISLPVVVPNTSVFQATAANQEVVGSTSGPDTLTGGYAGDVLVGNSGKDTFDYNAGSGAETISENAAVNSASANAIQFGSGITASSVSLNVNSSGALVLNVGSSGDSLTLEGFNPTNPLASVPIQAFKFADGTSLSLEQLLLQLQGSQVTGSITNADGSTTTYAITPGGSDTVYSAETVNSAGQQTQGFGLHANGYWQRNSYTYNSDGSYVNTLSKEYAGDPGPTTFVLNDNAQGQVTASLETDPDGTTTATTNDSQGRAVTQNITRPDGSKQDDSYTYNSDGSFVETIVKIAAGGGGTTTFVLNDNAQGQLTASLETDPDGTTTQTTNDSQGRAVTQDITRPDGSKQDDSYTYNSDGSYVETLAKTPAGGGAVTTETIDYGTHGQLTSDNSYTPAADGSYNVSWDKADGSSGGYWWNASTLEYQTSWHDGSTSVGSTDTYQYAAGGSPGGSGVSFTETFSDTAGDEGTRRYDASTGVTTVSWDSTATGTITGTVPDSGFIGFQNDGELTSSQLNPTFFNPTTSPAFQNFLAGH